MKVRTIDSRALVAIAAAAAALAGLQHGTGSARAMGAAQVPPGAQPSPASASRAWSPPSVLSACGVGGGPLVAFPSLAPATPTGPGAIVWPAHCGAGGAGHAGAGISVAALRSGGPPAPAGVQPLAASNSVVLAAVGASLGRVAVVTASASAAGPSTFLEGRSTEPRWARRTVPSSAAPAIARAYLGDVALALIAPGGQIEVTLQRYYSRSFGPARTIPIPAGPVTALTAAMDYRSDVLLAWQQNGSIYAHMLRASGGSDPTQRVGPSGPDPQLQAVVSDDDRGMIVWSTTTAGTTPTTRVYESLSGGGVRFRSRLLLAGFADPQRVGGTPGSLVLQRLSTENVMLAWTTREQGRYSVRAAAAVFAATRPSTLLSAPSSQGVLAGLAPGSAGEAIALWSTAPRLPDGSLDGRHAELWAARTYIRHSRAVFGAPEMIAPAGPNVAPALAVDPGDDHVVAAWMTLAPERRIEYAFGAGASGYRPSPASAAFPASTSGTHWLRITAGALAATLVLALLALVLSRRRRARAR